MTDQDKLPAIVTLGQVAVQSDDAASLVSRGLMAIESSRKSLQPVIIEPEEVAKNRAAAEQGDVTAQYDLAEAYYFGNGVVQNYGEALKWFQRAADHGCDAALYCLGGIYSSGEEGAPKDDVKAYMCFYLAWNLPGTGPRIFWNPAADQQMESLEPFLSIEHIVEARKLAREWAKKYMTPEEISDALAEAEKWDNDNAP